MAGYAAVLLRGIGTGDELGEDLPSVTRGLLQLRQAALILRQSLRITLRRQPLDGKRWKLNVHLSAGLALLSRVLWTQTLSAPLAEELVARVGHLPLLREELLVVELVRRTRVCLAYLERCRLGGPVGGCGGQQELRLLPRELV